MVPGLVHAAAVDALNGDAFEDDVFGEIQRDGFRGEAEEGDAASAAHDVEGGADGVGVSGHFENDVDTLASGFFVDDLAHVFF